MQANYFIIRGAGLLHEGSLRAENKEYEDKREAFEQFSKRDLKFLFGSEQQRKTKAFRRSLLAFVTCPLTDTSNEKQKTR